MFTADRLLETTQRVSTADNDINAIRNMGAIPEGYADNGEDCDDNDPNVGVSALDNDCDGVLSSEDCDDNDDTSWGARTTLTTQPLAA